MNIVFCDIDGTFQELGGDVPEINEAAIIALQNQGDQFVFISGRGYGQIEELVDSLGTDCDIIFSNGAGHKFRGEKLIYNHALSLPEIENVLTILEKKQLFYHLHTSHGVLLKPIENYSDNFLRLRKKLLPLGEDGKRIMDYKEQYFTEECQHVKDPLNYLEAHPEIKVVKIEVMEADDHEHEELRTLFTDESIFVFSSFIQCTEMVNPMSSKGEAIKEYMKKFPQAKSYGIGDGENDIDMLAVVDVPVAVSNAKAIVKEKCRYITDTCNDGGVGKFIFEHLVQT